MGYLIHFKIKDTNGIDLKIADIEILDLSQIRI